MPAILLATRAGLLTLDESGATVAADFPGDEVVAVDARGGRRAAAISGRGVYRDGPDGWQYLGLEGVIVWAIALDEHGAVYAGIEPAGLVRLGDGDECELVGLAAVDGHVDWHSPWGPADLAAIALDGDRIVVGVEVGGVAVSHDRGATWEARSVGLYEDVHHVIADGPVLVATTGMGCYRSGNEGRTWTWEQQGIDRGYTQGLARTGRHLVVSASSGPPPMWERGGPEAALFRADAFATPLRWEVVHEHMTGNVERLGVAADGDFVVAATTAGEVLVSHDAGATFALLRSDVDPVHAVAIAQ